MLQGTLEVERSAKCRMMTFSYTLGDVKMNTFLNSTLCLHKGIASLRLIKYVYDKGALTSLPTTTRKPNKTNQLLVFPKLALSINYAQCVL